MGAERAGRFTYGGSDEGGRSELRECLGHASFERGDPRCACCWMTASSWTTTWRTTSGVCSQLVASSGSPAGSGRAAATASPSCQAAENLVCIQAPSEGSPPLHLRQRRLRLGQPEGHVHGAVQVDGGGQGGAGLLPLAGLAYSRPSPRWQWAMSGRMPSSSARARACW